MHDVGEADGVHYLVLEHIEGETLAERIWRGPVPAGEALLLAADIAEALDAAHRQGLIHRDLKPGNVMPGSATERDDRQVPTVVDVALYEPEPVAAGTPTVTGRTPA